MLLSILFVIAIICVDQLSKYWAVTRLASRGTIPLIENVFHLTYAENRGAAFSMFENSGLFLIIVTSVAMIVVVIALYRKWVNGSLARWACLFILAGGIGNLIDRITQGYVVDMFDFRLINFAIFNVADIFITTGGGLLLLYIVLELIADKKKSNIKDTIEGNSDAET